MNNGTSELERSRLVNVEVVKQSLSAKERPRPTLASEAAEFPRTTTGQATPFPPLVPMPAALSDAEIDDICAGLRQNAAKVRYLRRVLQVPVLRKPNGRPLVLRSDWERRGQAPQSRRLGGGPKWSRSA